MLCYYSRRGVNKIYSNQFPSLATQRRFEAEKLLSVSLLAVDGVSGTFVLYVTFR